MAAPLFLRDRPAPSGWIYVILCACMLGFSGYHVLMKQSLNNHGTEDDACHMFRFGFWRDCLAALGLGGILAVAPGGKRDGDNTATVAAATTTTATAGGALDNMEAPLLIPSLSPARRLSRPALYGLLILAVITSLERNLFAAGLSLTSPTHAAVFQPSIPVVTFVISVALKEQPLKVATATGVTVCVLGAVVATLWQGILLAGFAPAASLQEQEQEQELVASSKNYFLGSSMLLIQCIASGSHLHLVKFILRYYNSPLGITLAGMLGCSLTDFGILVASGCVESMLSNLTLFDVSSVLYAALVVSAGIHSVLNWCTGRVGPTTVSICFPLQPVFSALLGTLVLGSPLYLGNVMGGILVAIGLIAVEIGRLEA